MGPLDAPRVTKICCPPAADNRIARIRSAPANSIQGGRVLTGKNLDAARHHRTQGTKNYSQGTIAGTGGVTGGVMRASQDRRGGLGVVSFVSSHDHGRP